MRQIFYFFFFLSTILCSQTDNWWVFFNDKDCDPLIRLSDKSIERRVQKKIPFDTHDVSICQNYIDSLQIDGVTIRQHSRWFNAISISVNSEYLLERILAFSFVKKVQPVNKIRTKHKMPLVFNDKFSKNVERSGSVFSYGPSFNQINMLGGVDLHNEGFLGENMVIAIFDAGFDDVETLPIFENLWNNNQIQDTYDFVDNDEDVFGGSAHGTMVLSTMGGYMIDSLIGTAPEATYMLFRTEDSGSETLIEEDNWAAAAEYADSVGVDIINSSLGYTILYDDTLNSHSYSDMDGNSTLITNAADLAASRGILVVNSAGNSGNSEWYYIGAPADGDSVLAVGAVDALGDVASFSSRGPSYDGRVKPNVCAQGVYAIVADLDSTIRVANGTSFSAPILAGLAACLWQAEPELNNMDILNSIEQSAHLFYNPNDSLGYGIPNFHQAYLANLNTNVELEESVSLYPNPFQTGFFVRSNSEQDIYVDVFNIMGVRLFSTYISAEEKEVFVDQLFNMPAGFYFLQINKSSDVYSIVKLDE